MAKKYELIRPKSLTDSNYEDYEYLIRWIGNDGSEYIYLFYDAIMERSTNGTLINPEDSERIETLTERRQRKITLTGDDFSIDDLDIIEMLFSNKYVTRLLTDNTIERYAPDNNSFSYRLRDGRYSVSFTLNMVDLAVWK